MNNVLRYLGQALMYALFMGFTGYFAVLPTYSPLQADEAVVRYSIGHYGQLKVECRQRTAEELAKMPPNMRAAADCERERSPIDIELLIDDKLIYKEHLNPTGLSKDGRSYTYQTVRVPQGTHLVTIRMRDSIHEQGFNYEKTAEVKLQPGGLLAIDFNSEEGYFRFVTPKNRDG